MAVSSRESDAVEAGTTPKKKSYGRIHRTACSVNEANRVMSIPSVVGVFLAMQEH